MTPRQSATLAVRLFSIYALYGALGYAATAFSMVGIFGTGTTLPAGSTGILQAQALGIFAHLLLLAGFALFLWVFADGLAARMVDNLDEATPANKLSQIQWQTITFTTIGLYTTIQAAGQIVNQIASLITLRQFIGTQVDMKTRADLMSACALLLLGSWLLFGSRSLIKLLRTARDFGRDAEPVTASLPE